MWGSAVRIRYGPPDMIDKREIVSIKEVKLLLTQALPKRKISDVAPIIRGSTNLIFQANTNEGEIILKIAYREDRIKEGTLEKEAKILKQFERVNWEIPIPKILWHGRTKDGLPAHIQTALKGTRIEDLLTPEIDATKAAGTLGKFVAHMHGFTEKNINEFERGRKTFPNFRDFAEHRLNEWRPLCLTATHIPIRQIENAYDYIRKNLHFFTEKKWSYQHADISKENLLGEIRDNTLFLTGLCDFENVQTGPIEYDIATTDDAIFLFYPYLESPFLKGYESVRAFPQNFEIRLKVVNLFRALRYIKRSVKYNEVHYYEHDQKYFTKWLEK